MSAYWLFSLLLVLEVAAARAILFSDGNPLRTIGLEAAFILALLSIVEVVAARWRLVTYAITAALVSLALLVIVIYASWANTLLVPGSLRFLGEAWGAKTSVLALFRPGYLLFVLFALIAAVVAWRSRPTSDAGGASRHPVLIAIGALALIASVFLIESAGGAAADGDSMSTAQNHGLFAYEISALRDVGDRQDAIGASVDVGDPGSVYARVEQIQKRSSARRAADFAPGAYAGANIIIVQIESMQGFVLGLDIDGTAVTPNLNQLIKSSWYFPNAFAQIGVGTTSDAEFVANTSILAPTTGPACVQYVGRDFPSLPRLLRDPNYYSFTMHANTAQFWNRTQLYPALGFADYFDRSYFGLEDKVGMGMSDGLMLRRALPVMLNEAREGKYYVQLVTLSPHHPFDLPEKKQKLQLPGWLGGTVVGDYLQAMNYEDRCLGWLIRQLKESGEWDRSIVVFYGDHYGLRPEDLSENVNQQRYELLLGHPYTLADRGNIPFIVHLPRQKEPKVGYQPVGQADVMPTIADALGLDLGGVPHFGSSVFDDGPYTVPLNVPMPQGTFAKGETLYVGPQRGGPPTAVSLKTYEQVALPDDYAAGARDALELTQLSAAYIKALPSNGIGKVPEGANIPSSRRKK